MNDGRETGKREKKLKKGIESACEVLWSDAGMSGNVAEKGGYSAGFEREVLKREMPGH